MKRQMTLWAPSPIAVPAAVFLLLLASRQVVSSWKGFCPLSCYDPRGSTQQVGALLDTKDPALPILFFPVALPRDLADLGCRLLRFGTRTYSWPFVPF